MGEQMNLIQIKLILVISTVIFSSGCVTTQQLNTRSGKPEVTISDVSKDEIKSIIIDTMSDRGWQLKEEARYQMVFTKLADKDLAARVLFGSNYDGIPEYRANFTIVDIAGSKDIRVIQTSEIVTNPGSTFERRQNIDEAKARGTSTTIANTWQADLNSLKATLGKKSLLKEVFEKGQGKIGVELKEDSYIIGIVDKGPASKVGIKVGDKIIKIDGLEVSDLVDLVSRLVGEPGTVVEITIMRENKEHIFKVVREIVEYK
jgi:membrane-associated protease RseP (regulator of RpoE activity)